MATRTGFREEGRPRSFMRRYPGITVSLVIFLALAGWMVYQVTRAVTAKPGRAGIYAKEVEGLAAKAQEGLPGPDKWAEYMRIVREADAAQRAYDAGVGVASASAGGYPDAPADWPTDVSWPPDPAFVGTTASHPRLVAHFRGQIATLRADGVLAELATLIPPARAVRPVPEIRMIEILLPELGQMRRLARLNRVRMSLAITAGDTQEFLEAFEVSLAISRIVGGQGTLIEHLVGYAITAMSLQEVRYQIADGALDGPALRGVAAAMDRQFPLARIQLAMDSERLMAMDTIEWTHSENGLAIPSVIEELQGSTMGGSQSSPVLAGLSNVLSLVLPSKKESQEAVNEFYSLIRADVGTAFYARKKPSEAVQFVEKLSSRYIVVKMLVPAVSKVLSTDALCKTDIAASRTLVALQLYRLEKERYPASLQELVPEYLKEIPADAFSAQGLVYRVVDATGTDPSAAIVLYSIGADGVDHGGTADPMGNPNTSGFDVVYTARRAPVEPPPGR